MTRLGVMVRAIAVAVALTGCGGPVAVPAAEMVDDRVPPVLTAVPPLATAPVPVPEAPASAALPRAGEKTIHGVVVTRDLAMAYGAYMAGDGDGALTALARAEAAAADDLTRWHIAQQRVQVLVMMGRTADADADLARATELEAELFGTDVGTAALRGETRLWLDETRAAAADFTAVVEAIGPWRLPTSYLFPPSNLGQLANLSTAQIRAHAGLAALAMLGGDAAAALPWAQKAESLLADVFAVSDHPLYGLFVPTHADAYYGRALNLGVLGAATVVTTGDPAAGEPYFAAADATLDAIGFATPKVTVRALRALGLLQAGHTAAAAEAAEAAAAMAAEDGLTDLVWRIETLRGEALLAGDSPDAAAAEAAFRRAQAAVDLASGALATDAAKRRFGIGKDDITDRLARLDVAKGDLDALFRDMERGRARAFVDMLARQAVAAGVQGDLVGRIHALDAGIRRQRLLSASPRGATAGARAEEQRLVAERASRVAELRRVDPELADVLSIAVQELADIRGRLGAGEVMAYALPARAGEPVRLLLARREGARVVSLDATHEDLARRFDAFQAATFDAYDPDRQKALAAEIERALDVPAWGATTALYVVPSGQLYFVPWGALDGAVPVAVLPTGGWLIRTPPPVKNGVAAVVGDPEFFGQWDPLPGARAEARAVADEVGAAPLIGPAATEDALRGRIDGGVGVLHLATHAYFDAEQPLRSALVLSGDGSSVPLTAARLFAAPLPARLVVLSACETGVGRAVAGDDFLGLVRSFYLGGARTVVNSLWPVDDAGTKVFMETFHRAARSGDYGRAWLAARDAVRAAGFPPAIYGAFVLGGAIRG